MRALCLTVVPLLVVSPLAAQSPTSGPSSVPAAAAPRLSLFFDGAGLFDGRPRIGLEALVYDGWTVSVAASRTRTSSVVIEGPGYVFCIWYTCPLSYFGTGTSYSGSSLAVAVRSYPMALSFNRGRSLVAAYFAASVAYHHRIITQTANTVRAGNPPVPERYPDLPISEPVSTMPMLHEPPVTSRASSWEPGAEVGLRLVAAEPVFLDVGGSFTWVTNNDPVLGLRTGRFDSRFVVAVGIGL